MTEYLTEQEQIQQLKNWLKQYSMTILAGVLAAVVITSCWHYWQNYRNNILLHASAVYDDMLTKKAQNQLDDTDALANKLFTDYPHTPYAPLAALMLARNALIKNDTQTALKQLNWVIRHGSDRAIRQIARIRAARVMITDNQPDAALALLKKVDDKSFLGLIDEVKGDAYLAAKNTPDAKKAYQLAIQELPNADTIRPILAMKLDNLAISS